MTDLSRRVSRTVRRALALGVFALVPAAANTALAQSRPTIILDPGHGGFDRGGVPGQQISEKDKTLDVARRLRSVLQQEGYRVVMTRDSDVFVPLGQRVAIANSYRGATFVSIHFNCAPRLGANGIETYYYRRDSAALAASIHRNVVAGVATDNRGVRRRGFFVLRRTANPSVLVECGFLTNPMEGRLAQTPSYRQQLAEHIARGVQRRTPSVRRPLARDATYSPEVLPQPFIAEDFVRPAPVSRRVHVSKASRHKRSTASRHTRITKKKTNSANSDNEERSSAKSKHKSLED